MDESPADVQLVHEPKDSATPVVEASNGQPEYRTPEELVAKAIAPVKREFLRPPPVRPVSNSNEDGAASESKEKPAQPSVGKEKKSKRQAKRDRLQQQKSTSNICPEVAKTGDPSSCPYSDKCRFSHDVEAFKDQKLEDLEGECPFVTAEEPCPYGLACRFLSTHPEGVSGMKSTRRNSSEVNGLRKDVQRLLWKNKMKFPKADAKVKALGLMGPANSKAKISENKDGDDVITANNCDAANGNGSNALVDATEIEKSAVLEENKDVEDPSESNESRPLKKPKCVDAEDCCDKVEGGGVSGTENVVCESSKQPEADSTAEILTPETDGSLKVHPREKKIIDFRDKLYLAPLTTVGNLPFRRVCKVLGADVTCGEMAMCTNLLQGQASEWALLRRHVSEDLFGVQICGAFADTVSRAVELIEQECSLDFIDINMGCPIDLVCNKGAGSALLMKPMRMKGIIEAASGTMEKPLTVKVRTAYFEGKNRIDSLIADMGNWGASAVTIHGRSRQQRYSKLADWEYVYQCANKAPDTLHVLGNGDIFSYLDWNKRKVDCPKLSTCMIARGALVKPWLFTEIKEQRHWDISSGERLDILKKFVRFGLEHWGSDTKGVETTRRFLLEWLSYTCRYVPVGLLEVIPQRLNWRQPSYFGRNDLETLMASDSAVDWIRISEMLLGKVPEDFTFAPKHKSNAYDRAENG
ncbi:tRNA-dihydrouridine(47) synthase [NAD(P)(+)]-like isoform X1 [Cannabis sativa]|uniref:tRNA-dihydrouridine(47) synthase [NAD(P)(+)]-like isoform X1 n=1 Tax=Cannabis sativa TaxID=3483 RepID=UPI0029CA7514|nr:tRNA-dihydrouridine(47) synthase [NAD(P)(+)]-like isoform X1 [Cannabis sativa]